MICPHCERSFTPPPPEKLSPLEVKEAVFRELLVAKRNEGGAMTAKLLAKAINLDTPISGAVISTSAMNATLLPS